MPMKTAQLVLVMIERLVDEAEPEQELVEQPLRLQDADPGIDADQERRPERQDDQHHEHRLDRARRPRHAVGDRIADQQRDQRRDGGDPDAREVGLPVERVGRRNRRSCSKESWPIFSGISARPLKTGS